MEEVLKDLNCRFDGQDVGVMVGRDGGDREGEG